MENSPFNLEDALEENCLRRGVAYQVQRAVARDWWSKLGPRELPPMEWRWVPKSQTHEYRTAQGIVLVLVDCENDKPLDPYTGLPCEPGVHEWGVSVLGRTYRRYHVEEPSEGMARRVAHSLLVDSHARHMRAYLDVVETV